MTPTEANDLAVRIVNTWPRGPGIEIWADVLIELHTGPAGTAYIRLRNDTDNAPSVHRYLTVYRALHTAASDAKCEHCGNDGTITGPEFVRHGHTYQSAIPCPHCEHGRHAARWMKRHHDEHPTKPLPPAADPPADLFHEDGAA